MVMNNYEEVNSEFEEPSKTKRADYHCAKSPTLSQTISFLIL